MATLTLVGDTDIPPETLGNRLRAAREYRQLEQSDIATSMGLTRQTVSNYERGNTRPGKLVINEWARVCEVNRNWLEFGIRPDNGPSEETVSKITNRYHARASNRARLTLVDSRESARKHAA